jgi:hypothetical protein
MATTTPNYGWPVPTSTDLVKNGATAIEALGDAIDASLLDLKGGTTGQVLSKTTNTDMDFTWVTSDDANAIQNTIVDAKGDLIAASAADTPARLAVGSNGETLVADSSTSTGLRYTSNFAAGKNAIINGAFNVWQRGTSFTSPTSNTTYTADRWLTGYSVAPTTYSVSQQAFTAGTAPVAGYEGTYFYRGTITTAGSNTAWEHKQRIEDVRTFAGQTVTLSFWAKADSSRTGRVFFLQNFGSGGSGSVYSTAYNISLTTSWTRFTQTVSIASVSGKTIGTGSYLEATIEQPSANGSVIDIWGVQVEAGSVATAFQTATGTIQGELAACQRYFEKSYDTNVSPGTASQVGGINMATGATSVANNTTYMTPVFRVDKRTTPTVTCYSYAGTSGVASKVSDGLDLSANTATAKNIGFTGFWVYNNNASTFTTTQGAMFQWTASAEL